MSGRLEILEGAEEGHEIADTLRRGIVEARLEQLQAQILNPILESAKGTPLVKELYGAANEAAALAWLTMYPLLFFPALLEEKVRTALKRWERQSSLYAPKAVSSANY